MNSSITMDELWAHLTQTGKVDGDVPNLPENEVPSPPWYVAGLVGIAGWIAAAFLIAFLAATGLIDDRQSMLIVGIVFCVVALGVKYMLRHAIFPNQLAFALSLAGQGLIIGSRFEFSTSGEILTIVVTVLILEGLLFLLYPDGLHRLISLVAIIGAVVVQLVDWSMSAYIPLLVLLLAAAALFVWWRRNALLVGPLRDFFAPLSIGLPVGALGLCIVQLTGMDFADGPWWLAGLGMGLLLIVLGGIILGELDVPLASAAGVGLLGIAAILMIPSYETPGIMTAALILGVAFWRKQWLLMGIGIAGFGLFISFYYYNLELTLLTKSMILAGSGLALLILRLLSHRLFGGVEVAKGERGDIERS